MCGRIYTFSLELHLWGGFDTLQHKRHKASGVCFLLLTHTLAEPAMQNQHLTINSLSVPVNA